MPNKLLTIFILLTIASCKNAPSKNQKTSVADDNSQQEWQHLFNGENLAGWIPKFNGHKTGENYANTFRVVDDKIQVSYADYSQFESRFGHLFYERPFGSFHLKFTYRFTEEWMDDAPSYTYRNSGLMFYSQSPQSILKDQDWPISVEFQLLARQNENEPRPTGNMCSPGTEVFYNGEMDPRHCIDSSSKTYDWEEWVTAELIVYQDSLIIHKIDGARVLEYSKPQIGGGVVSGFDPENKTDGKPLREGYIALQAEGQGVEFKDIMIKELY